MQMETLSPVVISSSNAILLLDDDSDIVATIEQLLRKHGFSVFGFTNPKNALDDFQVNSEQYGLVISDIRMPEMNGYEFVKRVKRIKPDVNVFLMTNFDNRSIEYKIKDDTQ